MVAQSDRAEGWLFESQPRHTKIVKTVSDTTTPKRSAIDVSVTVLRDDHYKPMSQ